MDTKKYIKYIIGFCVLLLLGLCLIFVFRNKEEEKETSHLDLSEYNKLDLNERVLNRFEFFDNEYEEDFIEIKNGEKKEVRDGEYIEFKNGNINYYYDDNVVSNAVLKNDKDEEVGVFNDLYNTIKVYHVKSGHEYYVLAITSDNKLFEYEYYGTLSMASNSYIEIKTINKVISVEGVICVEEGGDSCQIDIIYNSSDNKKYSSNEGKEYNYVFTINDYVLEETDEGTTLKKGNTAYIMENNDVIINDKIIPYKYKRGFTTFGQPGEVIGYFITDDNHFYSVKKNELVTPSIIKDIYYKYDDDNMTGNYLLLFEDNTYITFDGSEEELIINKIGE